MSPIMVRPVREQLEHDRLIRFLLNKYNRKFEVLSNVGDEHAAAIKIGTATFFPDLVLTDGKKVGGLVEIETGESVNNLEAMAQWVHFSHARVPFHLYVPVQSYDSARRLCELNHVAVAEIWTYRGALEGFDLVRMYHNPSAVNAAGKQAMIAPLPKPKAPEPEKPPVAAAPINGGATKAGAKPAAAPPPPLKVPAKTAAAKPVVKPVVKPVAPPVAKPIVKPVVKPAAKPVAKPPAKPVAKPAKAAPKPSKPAKAKATRPKPAKAAKKASKKKR